MADEVAPWNLLQIALIAAYPCWQSFTRMPSGMSLLAVYLFLFVLCIPPIFIQLKLGNHQQKGVVKLLSTHFPIFKGVAITLIIQLFLMCVYMVPLVTHYGLFAIIAVIQQPYVWGHCANAWNMPSCVDDSPLSRDQYVHIPLNREQESPETQFFNYGYLQISANISDVRGFPQWNFSDSLKKMGVSIMPIAMVVTWKLIFLAIAFGGRVCGWILFILGPAFLTLLFVTLGYGHSNLDKNGTSTFLHNLYTLDLDQFNEIHPDTPLIKDWTAGFVLIMHSLPIWTAILPTMGKMTGTGRLSRNISWLLVVLVYAATCQLPQLTMAPYIGNLFEIENGLKYSIRGIDVAFTTMSASFANLDIPPAYALLFYLAIFLAGLMFLILAMFTILDNLVDGLCGWADTFRDHRRCVNFCAAFALIAVGVGAGILHTTQAGLYYIILMDQSVSKLFFITVVLYGLCLIVVYAKQNFGIAERVIVSVWATVSTIITGAIFLYCFVVELRTVPGYNGVKIGGTWDLVMWILASAPFLAIPAAAIHSFQVEEGSMKRKLRYVFCGTKQDRFDPPQEYGYHRPEPSAPPYGPSDPHMYAYMDDGYPMTDVPYSKVNEDEMNMHH